MLRLFLLTSLCTVTAHGQSSQTIVWTNPSGSWMSAADWTPATVPGRYDLVKISDSAPALVTIQPGSNAKAGGILISGGRETHGALEISGDLELRKGVITDLGNLAGKLYIGVQHGTASVIQDPGTDVYVSKSIRVGDLPGGVGTYRIDAAALESRQGIMVARGTSATGTFTLLGADCSVITNWYRHGPGKATLEFVAAYNGPSTIVARKGVKLDGSLRVDMTQLTIKDNEYVLIDNRGAGPIEGGFEHVMINGAGRYELSYHGGDGNDLVLKRHSKRQAIIDRWRDNHFEHLNDPALTGLHADFDDDGVTNIAEYKTGTSAVHPELWSLTPGLINGKWRVRYTQRTDREDARIVPQVRSFETGRWTPNGISTSVISAEEDTELIEAEWSSEDPLDFRLAGELLPDPSAPMNVMLFIVDDLNSWVGCMNGHPQTYTPNLDGLATRGVLFTNAHCNGTLCGPSRAALLTGIRPSTSGIYHNSAWIRDSPVLATAVTLPEHFALNGYDVSGSGKVFHRQRRELWDEFGPRMGNPPPLTSPVAPKTQRPNFGGSTKPLDWHPMPNPDDEFLDYKIADWTRDKLARLHDNPTPYFHTCGTWRPHLPWVAPARFFDRLDLNDIVLPPTLQTDIDDLSSGALGMLNFLDEQAVTDPVDLRRDAVRAYLACITFADEQIGRVLEVMDNSTALSRNTVIVLVSDHGFHLGQKQHWRKGTLWEETARVPMIIVAPGTTTPGTVVDQPASLLDIYPTLADLTGTVAPLNLEGVSLAPVLADPDSAENRVVITTELRKRHSLRDNRWRYLSFADGNGGEELYDHTVDPNEWTNLANDANYTAVLEMMRAARPAVDAPRVPKR